MTPRCMSLLGDVGPHWAFDIKYEYTLATRSRSLVGNMTKALTKKVRAFVLKVFHIPQLSRLTAAPPYVQRP